MEAGKPETEAGQHFRLQGLSFFSGRLVAHVICSEYPGDLGTSQLGWLYNSSDGIDECCILPCAGAYTACYTEHCWPVGRDYLCAAYGGRHLRSDSAAIPHSAQ